MTTWITDDRGNRCSVEYWGSEEAAREALATLKNCDNCTNCSRCSDCSHLARLNGKRNLHGDPEAVGSAGAPPVPVIESIHARVLEAASAPGALKMSCPWHECATTHCRAGWVVHLAGEAGYALERHHNTPLAAQLIYKASNPSLPVSPTRFYETNKVAMADMKRMAELEAVATQ